MKIRRYHNKYESKIELILAFNEILQKLKKYKIYDFFNKNIYNEE